VARGASARRHAQAVFQIALERGELEGWRADLRRISAIMTEPRFSLFLETPKIPFTEKAKLLSERLEGVSDLAMNFAYLLVAKGRTRIVEDIAREYERLVDAHYGIEHAEVTTAVPIDDLERERLARRLSEVVGKEVVLTIKVDPQITGGLIARIGDKLIDGSVMERLAALRKSLIKMSR